MLVREASEPAREHFAAWCQAGRAGWNARPATVRLPACPVVDPGVGDLGPARLPVSGTRDPAGVVGIGFRAVRPRRVDDLTIDRIEAGEYGAADGATAVVIDPITDHDDAVPGITASERQVASDDEEPA